MILAFLFLFALRWIIVTTKDTEDQKFFSLEFLLSLIPYVIMGAILVFLIN